MTEDHFFASLPHRGQVIVSGSDAPEFLQGLITNNIETLSADTLLYACLLTPQGKFLHDFFIREDNDTLILDCEGGERAQDLAQRLKRYALRADVEIEVTQMAEVFALLPSPRKRASAQTKGDPSSSDLRSFAQDDKIYKDPRHPNMGWRSYDKPEGIAEQPFEKWDRHRISLCIPDGSRDLIIEKSTMDEARMDTINAIDYEKGCYVGQELTARMHYRGLGKKHLEIVDPNNLPEKAELRSSCGDIGLALVRDNAKI